MFGNCPVTVMWRVTAIYRAVIYRFDCINRIGVNCNHYIGNSLQRLTILQMKSLMSLL